jgi:carboxypeptidase PM20D1
MRRLARLLLAGLAILAVVLLVRTWRFGPMPSAPVSGGLEAVDPEPVARRLAAAIRVRTVSRDGEAVAADAFRALRRFLEETYPATHARLARETVAEHSLLYAWPGSDPALPPALVMAHQDVVPVEEGTETAWSHPPFDGQVDGGFVWGRGALDDKASLIAIFEAVERLVQGGLQPRRTLVLFFGHDEETTGSGARAAAALLASRGVRLESTLDEGLAVTRDIVPGLARPVAHVGVAEKGIVSVDLEVDGESGHSSIPPAHTAIGVLAAAVARIEDHPLAPRAASLDLFLDAVGREMSFPRRLVLGNRWLFGGLVRRALARAPATNAALRTTTAVTLFSGGVKSNVLPARARAVVNFRIVPGDTTATVLDHVRSVVADPRVRIRVVEGRAEEPTATSSTVSPAYARVGDAVRAVFPGAVVAPSLVLGATDGRNFQPVSADVYRFVPITFTPGDLARAHGADERIEVAALGRAVAFYVHYLAASAR